MKCKYCSYDIKPGDRYCENCGASVAEAPAPADNAPYQGGGQYYPQNTNTAYGYGNNQYGYGNAQYGYGNDQYGNGYNQGSGSPQYVGFGEAIKLFFVNYVNFKGRSTRSEFWFAYLFQFIVRFCSNFIFSIFGSLMFVSSTSIGLGGDFSFTKALGLLIDLALLIPALSISVRRLHDSGRSGLWALLQLAAFAPLNILMILIAVFVSLYAWSIELFLILLAISALISLAGIVIMIVFWCMPSDATNKWGAPANPFKR